jgi:hypothetical protein
MPDRVYGNSISAGNMAGEFRKRCLLWLFDATHDTIFSIDKGGAIT